MSTVADVPALLASDVTPGRDRPLLTFYDDATGERTDLSAAALGSWVARTAAMLRDGCGLGAGDRAALLLPPHWQTAAVLLGSWSVGMAVSFRLAATAGLAPLGPGNSEPLDATFVARPRVDDWLDHVPAARHRFVLGLAPAAAPLPDVPDGYRDFIAEVHPYAGHRVPHPAITAADAATVDGTSYHEWGSVAQALAAEMGLRAGDRVLVDAAEHEHPVKWLLAPLAAGASVVLCANLDEASVASRVAAERVSRVL